MKQKYFILMALALGLACADRDTQLDTSITVPVSVEEIKLQPIEEFITTNGTAQASQEVELLAETDGYYRPGSKSNGSRYSLGDFVNSSYVILFLDNP